MRLSIQIILTTALLMISGCAGISLPPVEGVRLSAESISTLKFSALRGQPPFFKSLLTGAATHGGEKQTLRYAVISQDKQLRIEVFPTTSFYTLLLFKSDGDKFSFENFSDHSIEKGNIEEETLKDLFGISLTTDELRSVILGALPQGLPTTLQMYDGPNVLQLFSADPSSEDIEFYGEITKSSGLFSKMTFLQDGHTRAGVTFESFTDSNFPERFTVTLPRFDVVLRFTVRSLSLEGTMDKEQFLPEP